MALTVGAVVRIELVATVVAADATTVTVASSGGNRIVLPKAVSSDPGFTYEEIPAPEPAYVAGELYRDAGGNVFQRTDLQQPGDRWRVMLHDRRPPGQYVGEQMPVRPLKRLTPEAPAPP